MTQITQEMGEQTSENSADVPSPDLPPAAAEAAAPVPAPGATAPVPLGSVHTSSFAQILSHFGSSIAVTTYQAGKLVLLRAEMQDRGPVLNTHFRTFNKPMGFACEHARFALGTNAEIWEFHNIPAVAPKLDIAGSNIHHDACFLPRSSHITGDVQIHEMAWVAQESPNGSALSELCFVATRFSCLARYGGVYSFNPIWKPPFITALSPEDRCHLNGLSLRDGKVRYLTALGETDKLNGWRENKRAGGILMEVPSGQIIARGLSMPHSPRWHNGKLWVLESGNGSIGIIDEQTGKYQEVCRLPGFTRGFDFLGPYALVGLSQVRETAVFSGIAIAELPQKDRCCGVWAIDTRTGQIAGFVKFTDAVQEIFAVQVLRGLRWPEVLSDDPKRISETYELPNEALQMVPRAMRSDIGAAAGNL